MKRTFYLLKTLLVAVGLCVGASAWAQTTAFSEDFTDKGSTDPSDYGFTAGTCSGEQTATVSGGLFTSSVGKSGTGSLQNNYTEHSATFSPIGSGNVVTFSCTWMPGPATGNGKSILALQNADGNQVLTMQKGNGGSSGQYHFYINGTDVKTLGSGNNGDVYEVSATINMSTQKITALTIGSIYTLSDPISFDATTVSKIYIYNKNKANWVNTATLDNVVVAYEAAASVADVTYTYEDLEGNSLSSVKANQVVKETIGATISELISSYNADFYSEDGNTKYVYNSYSVIDDATTVPAGGTTVTLKFTPYAKYNYTVSSSLGTEIASGYVYADAPTVYVPYPKYELSGTDLYVAAKNSNSDYWRKTYTITADNQAETITYTKSVENVIYYSEGENIGTLSPTYRTDYSFHIRCSNAGAGYPAVANTDYKIVTLEPGKYVISTSIWGNATHKFTFKAGSTTLFELSCNGNIYDYTHSEIELLESTNITIAASYAASNRGVDFVYIQRTGDATVSKNITSAGWATYCSPYALDFSSSIENLTKAYIITGATGNTLNLTQITGTVPAETGILLEGEGNVAIPVVASSSTNVSANKLVGVTEEYSLAANGGYVLLNGANGVGFYINPDAAFTVGANTAYLPANFAAARAFYLFDEDATGINAVSTTKAETGNYYNLAGQRVAQPTKGLYIVNGKKVVIK